MLKWDSFVSEIRKELGAEISMSGTIKGWETKEGSFFCKECGLIRFFPFDETEYFDIIDLAERLGVHTPFKDFDMIEFEVIK